MNTIIGSKDSTFILIIIFSIFFLLFINHLFPNKKWVFYVNMLALSESTVLTFFFAKYPYYYSIWLFFASLFFTYKNRENELYHSLRFDDSDSSIFSSKIVPYFNHVGYFLLFCAIFYELIADLNFSSTSMLLIFFSVIMIYYENLVSKVGREIDFLVLFTGILFIFFFVPSIIYKLNYGLVGQTFNYTFFDQDRLVEIFLCKPLTNLLTLAGYNVWYSGIAISFEDTNLGLIRTVSIVKSCSGITSIQVFFSALISYILFRYKKIDIVGLTMLVLGSIIAYLANLFRMGLIILAGHYWGLDVMLDVHKYAGWIIFSFWVFLFFIFVEKTYNALDKYKL